MAQIISKYQSIQTKYPHMQYKEQLLPDPTRYQCSAKTVAQKVWTESMRSTLVGGLK